MARRLLIDERGLDDVIRAWAPSAPRDRPWFEELPHTYDDRVDRHILFLISELKKRGGRLVRQRLQHRRTPI